MYFVFLIGALIILAIGGGVLLGGVFTIVLIPLAVIGVIVTLAYMLASAAAQQQANAESPSGARRSPRRRRQTQGVKAPSSPESLVDARRSQQ